MQENDKSTEGQAAEGQAAELPSTEELAAELHKIEAQASGNATETAPDPADDGKDPPAGGTEAPDPGTDPPPDDTPASEPDAPDDPQDGPGDVQEADEPATIRSPHVEKKTADATRRQKAIAEAPRPPDPSEADLKEQARKDDIRAKMQLVQNELDETLEAAEACREELKDLSAELYPHLVESDHLVESVRGYVASQKKVRATRASSPEQIKRILEAVGKSPIDAAFQRQRARGMKRPTRTPVPAKPTGGDAAPGADKPKTNADAA